MAMDRGSPIPIRLPKALENRLRSTAVASKKPINSVIISSLEKTLPSFFNDLNVTSAELLGIYEKTLRSNLAITLQLAVDIGKQLDRAVDCKENPRVLSDISKRSAEINRMCENLLAGVIRANAVGVRLSTESEK